VAARLYTSFGWRATVVRLTAVGASGDLLPRVRQRLRGFDSTTISEAVVMMWTMQILVDALGNLCMMVHDCLSGRIIGNLAPYSVRNKLLGTFETLSRVLGRGKETKKKGEGKKIYFG
jgi:hypothetical protein